MLYLINKSAILRGLACEQALLFGRAKPGARERASERRSREGPAPRSRVSSRACTFHDIPQMESLLAGWAKIIPKHILVPYFFKRSCKHSSTDDPRI